MTYIGKGIDKLDPTYNLIGDTDTLALGKCTAPPLNRPPANNR